jgi:alpha-amylase/alpha-mannosidase (GH57 family)
MEKDPQNRLFARGPLQRLTAEMVRDQALVASGLLSTSMGGPPVMPPQPAGVWNSVYNYSKWIDAKGPNRYRRAIYTYIKRTSGYPSFLIFDASDHETSLARRIPTNTPLQALVTLNDPVYQECAQAVARRVLRETASIASERSTSDQIRDSRLAYETRLVLSRAPSPRELALLRTFYERARTMLKAPVLVNASTSAYRPSREVSTRDLNALTAVAGVLFNLDTALTR